MRRCLAKTIERILERHGLCESLEGSIVRIGLVTYRRYRKRNKIGPFGRRPPRTSPSPTSLRSPPRAPADMPVRKMKRAFFLAQNTLAASKEKAHQRSCNGRASAESCVQLGRALADSTVGQCSEIARTARIGKTHRGFSPDTSPPFSKTNGFATVAPVGETAQGTLLVTRNCFSAGRCALRRPGSPPARVFQSPIGTIHRVPVSYWDDPSCSSLLLGRSIVF